MRIYAQADEEKVRAEAVVREWQRSGFLDTSQAAQIANELRVDFRRTNFFLRALLFSIHINSRCRISVAGHYSLWCG